MSTSETQQLPWPTLPIDLTVDQAEILGRCCDQCEEGEIDVERNSFTHGADAYTGAGDVITDIIPCPVCTPARTLLARMSELYPDSGD